MTCGKKGFITLVLVFVFIAGLATLATISVLSHDDVITGHAIAQNTLGAQQNTLNTDTTDSDTSAHATSAQEDVSVLQEQTQQQLLEEVQETVAQEQLQEQEKATPIYASYTSRSRGGGGGSSSSSSSSSTSSSTAPTTESVQKEGIGAIVFSSAVEEPAIKDVVIEYNFISVPSDSPANIPATLVFEGLPYTSTPLVLQNGKVCTQDCSTVDYQEGTLTVDVEHFTNYTTVGNYPACSGTFSSPSSVTNNDSVILTLFNAEPASAGNNVTLYTPQGVLANASSYSISAPFSTYSWQVQSLGFGNHTFYASIEPLNCTLNFTQEVTNVDFIAPSAITNLTRINATNTSFTLTWNNPSDLDFSHVEVYLDGVFFANISDSSLTIDNLPKGVPHNVTLYTVDLNGNKNTTAVELFDVRPYFDCLTQLECDDGNPATLDYCSTESLDGLVCIHRPINLYGRIVDEDGNPDGGAQISLIDSSVFTIDFNSTEGDFEAVQPKPVPDLVADENGTYYGFADPSKVFHLAINGSIKRDFNVQTHKKKKKIDGTPISKPANFPIILPENGTLNVLFESASAGLRSDLLIESPVQAVIVNKSEVGKSANFTGLQAGDEVVLSIFVHADKWGLPTYKHYSNDSDYAIVERVDYNTWRVRFEDLDAQYSNPDWDYNDVVALIGLDTTINESFNNSAQDCDNDGYLNWQDDDDEWCDINEHDSEVDKNSTQWSTDYNVAGHIVYGGEFENENKYTCGEKVRFLMFGKNSGNQDLNITFYVESHVNGGKPDDAGTPCTVGGDILYCGDDQNPQETLYLPPDGQKYSKYFDFEIPCSYPEGKYDIHIQHNPKWGNMHKIGNFFVIPDTTAPGILVAPSPLITYTNETATVYYDAQDIPQPGTVRISKIAILFGSGLDVRVDKDITQDGPDQDLDPTNDNDYLLSQGGSFFNLTYNKSGHYTARFTAVDASNNTATFDLPVHVYLTEDEARKIYIDMINQKWNNTFGLTYLEAGGGSDPSDFRENFLYYDDACEEINVDVFFKDDQFATYTHMEYMTPLNTKRNPTYYRNVTQNESRVDEPVGGVYGYLTDQCLVQLNNRNTDNKNYYQHYILALANTTEEEFRGNVSEYLDYVWCKENSVWC